MKEQIQTPDISIIVPLLNEEGSLTELHELLSDTIEKIQLDAEFIFVDDGSTDGSFAVIQRLHEKDERIKCLRFRRNYGKSAALAEGFALSRGKYVVTLDADLQDDPAEIPDLIARLEEGYDLISGWKKERHDPFIKRHTSKIFNYVTGKMTGVKLHDMNCGLKIYRREVVQTIHVYGQRHRFLPALARQEGFRIGEKVIKHRARKYGVTKFGPSRFIAGFLDLITLLFLSRYVKRPLHLFGSLGILSFTLGTSISAFLAYERLFHDKYLSNRPLLFLGIVLLIIGTQFISLGLLGEMMTESRSESHKYSIRDRIGFKQKK